MKNQPCSCGCPEPHVIAKRTTLDGKRVEVWSDGLVTQITGIYYRGAGSRSRLSKEAANHVAENCCLVEAKGMPELINQAKKLHP